jgi:hypothetical protein
MNIIKRVAYYLGGFGIGLVLLYFFVSGSGASCEYDYGPNSRTLKNIKNKERIFSEISLEALKQHQLDTSAISVLLNKGEVLFSESNTKLDSCKIYVIKGLVAISEKSTSTKSLKITLENCDKLVTIQKALVLD